MTYSQTHNSPIGFFLATFFVVFGLTFVLAFAVGFVPYYIDGSSARDDFSEQSINLSQFGFDNYRAVALNDVPQLGNETPAPYSAPQTDGPVIEPERIVIRSIGLDLPVLNPTDRSIPALDEALLSGSVRYPDSAKLGEDGNIFIFGHSSHLPIVKNEMFRAFNDLPDLEKGDSINVQGGGKEYIYRITEVRQTDANEELVDLSTTGGKRLTLSTCNTFGAKSARWVVEAELIGAF